MFLFDVPIYELVFRRNSPRPPEVVLRIADLHLLRDLVHQLRVVFLFYLFQSERFHRHHVLRDQRLQCEFRGVAIPITRSGTGTSTGMVHTHVPEAASRLLRLFNSSHRLLLGRSRSRQARITRVFRIWGRAPGQKGVVVEKRHAVRQHERI